MQILILFAVLAVPPFVGSLAVANLSGPFGFVVGLAASLYMLRDALQICMMLMRHWQLFGRDMFLIEEEGRHRWVDAFELKSLRVPCRIRRQEFRPFIAERRARRE